jgi:cytochrome c biogenesis protein CcmG, thiol:disulfide interchange protein DsbE
MRGRAQAIRTGLALLVVGLSTGLTHAEPPTLGQRAPTLVARTATAALDVDTLRGRVVVLNFWASWCPPCRAELPVLATIAERHADEVTVVAVSADRHHDTAEAARIVAGLPLTAAFLDGAKKNGFGAPAALPMTYVLDRDGVVRAIFPPGAGELEERALEDALAPLLSR